MVGILISWCIIILCALGLALLAAIISEVITSIFCKTKKKAASKQQQDKSKKDKRKKYLSSNKKKSKKQNKNQVVDEVKKPATK